MKEIIWEVQYLSLPKVTKHCKKCGRKTAFSCSEKFRVNAQGKCLDIWLIYKCSSCDSTWNARVHSHISPQSIPSDRLKGFHHNEEALVAEYAMDSHFLHENGVEIEVPPYAIIGDGFLEHETVKLIIRSKYHLPVKVSALVREKLQLSQTAFLQRINNEKIESTPKQNLQKCKLKHAIVLIFNK